MNHTDSTVNEEDKHPKENAPTLDQASAADTSDVDMTSESAPLQQEASDMDTIAQNTEPEPLACETENSHSDTPILAPEETVDARRLSDQTESAPQEPDISPTVQPDTLPSNSEVPVDGDTPMVDVPTPIISAPEEEERPPLGEETNSGDVPEGTLDHSSSDSHSMQSSTESSSNTHSTQSSTALPSSSLRSSHSPSLAVDLASAGPGKKNPRRSTRDVKIHLSDDFVYANLPGSKGTHEEYDGAHEASNASATRSTTDAQTSEDGSEQEEDASEEDCWCFCRTPEFTSVMVQCEQCEEW
ncbi:hypothetical protein BJ684DRAFT_21623 [Piptocephalis cylindrospora]|uniref:Uncharacterized protein n=1 Tax=Piptocephalis cylindrospora TaxID=1907219 RepID=A0A4P9Y042_9FUNG|nr:hypothetical protein BJ684DRAFT_21623 [Piptocephalis cylindrospora]|eukprot:RKP11802.1 hypothetical protein BJ684DRAFT_21623 [Piptocephalis cylindrospora]